MCSLAQFVADRRVRCKLEAALLPSPLFPRGDKRRADPQSPGFRDDVPALQVADATRAAGIDDVSDRQLHEADSAVIVAKRDEHFGRLTTILAKKALDVTLMVFDAAVGPERTPEP
jgi:hypothetical protein